MTATLGLHLIFDMHRRCPGFNQRFHRADDIKSAAETGIRIHQQRDISNVRDTAHICQHIVQRRNSKIGKTKEPAATPAPER